jgi:hypothetical protein
MEIRVQFCNFLPGSSKEWIFSAMERKFKKALRTLEARWMADVSICEPIVECFTQKRSRVFKQRSSGMDLQTFKILPNFHF